MRSGTAALRTIDLSWNAAGDTGARALAAALPESGLTSLNLHANYITDAGAAALTEAVGRAESLVELAITGNKLSEAAAEGLAQAVGRNRERALCLDCGEVTTALAPVTPPRPRPRPRNGRAVAGGPPDGCVRLRPARGGAGHEALDGGHLRGAGEHAAALG